MITDALNSTTLAQAADKLGVFFTDLIEEYRIPGGDANIIAGKTLYEIAMLDPAAYAATHGVVADPKYDAVRESVYTSGIARRLDQTSRKRLPPAPGKDAEFIATDEAAATTDPVDMARRSKTRPMIIFGGIVAIGVGAFLATQKKTRWKGVAIAGTAAFGTWKFSSPQVNYERLGLVVLAPISATAGALAGYVVNQKRKTP